MKAENPRLNQDELQTPLDPKILDLYAEAISLIAESRLNIEEATRNLLECENIFPINPSKQAK